MFGRATVEFPLRDLGVRITSGAGLRGAHLVAPRILNNVIDADGPSHGALGSARFGPSRVPSPQDERDAAVCNSLGRVAIEQHRCDPTIGQWLIAMAPTYS